MFLTSGSSESVVVQTEYQVQRSLRIRSSAGAFLSRTPTVDGDRNKFTFSAWVKLGSTTSGALLSSDFASTGGLNEIYFSNGSIAFYFEGSGTKGLWYTTGFFRDPTAWYHVVVVADSTQAVTANMASVYVNGIKQTIAFTNLSQGTPAQNTNWWITSTVAHRIGNSATQSSLQFDGYIADMYFIDGQTLTPTSFGEYSAYGHWKPKQYDASTYGTTGFYLPFSNVTSTTTLCADASGNGNNWVPANISLTRTSLYSITGFDVTRGAGAFGNATLPSAGDGTNCYHFPKTDSTYTLNRTITAATKIEVYCYTDNSTGSNPCTITANGGTAKTAPANSTAFSWVKVDLGVTSLSSITVSNSASWAGSDFWLCCFIADNSVVYAYTTDSTYDSMYDVPLGGGGGERGNYATLNPLVKASGANSTYSNGNIAAIIGTGGYGHTCISTIAIPPGMKAYFEGVVVSVVYTTSCFFGIIHANDAPNDISPNSYTGQTSRGYGYGRSIDSNLKYNNNVLSSYGALLTNGSVVGVAFDNSAGTLEFFHNGVSQGIAFTGIPSGDYLFSVGAAGWAVQTNFGQQPFTYTPPAGFKALHTGNLYTPAITTPKMYHNTYTYLGNGAGLQVGDATSYLNSPDLVWIKNRSAAQSHTLFDSVRGVGNILSTDTTSVETTDANSLTQFNVNGFYLGSSAAVNTLNNSYVAWAWKAGTTTVTNTAGSITSQVRANQTSGFSVVTYTGNSVDGSTVGHGLGVAPKLVIVRTRNNGGNFRVMHTSLAASTNVYLNATNAADVITVTGGGGIATTPSSTMFTLTTGATSNANNVNASAWTYVAYCFAEISGYSKFGSYTGNGSTDGPFVYCGFRPASVMIKRTDVVDNWYIWDTTRNPSNVVGEVLYLNLTNAAASSNEMDIIATGFKIRSTATADNASGGTYIFITFAEAPLKYSLAR